MIRLSEKEISTVRAVGQVAGIFTLIVAFAMIFSLIQLKTINPLDNPAMVMVKDQYDKDPENVKNAEQVRAMDLMARKAYFATRLQVETGSCLLLAGAIVFLICHRLITGSEKPAPPIPGDRAGQLAVKASTRKYILASASFFTVAAVISSFILRSNLPDLNPETSAKPEKVRERSQVSDFKPDKTNFPFFRGQDSRGIAGGTGYPVEWNGEENVNIKWKMSTPKDGKSSPVIWGDKLFVTGAEGLECEVYCINKNTGAIIWTGSASGIPGEPSSVPEMDYDAGMAVSTAATNGKYVCAIFANGNLACFDYSGSRVWAVNLKTPENIYGYSSSLIIHDDLLLVQYDSDEKISLMGFNLETGELAWETLRRGRAVWSSPVIATFNGNPQLIINGNPAVTAFDPVTGKELWAVDCMTGDVAPSLAVNSTMVYAVTDYAILAAIKPGMAATIVWSDNYFTPDVSSPVATDDYLFISTGNGDVACYNALKGDTIWTHYYYDQFYASPIIADGNVWFLDRSGVMHIVKASDKYELVGEPELGESVDCTPAFSDKSIYIRGRENLYCISED